MKDVLFAVMLFIVMLFFTVMVSQPAHAERVVQVYVAWEVSAPGANTDLITDVTWGRGVPCRLTIQCDAGTVVNLMVSRDGTENALGMNESSAVVGGSTYTWDVHGLENGDTVNVQLETDSAVALVHLGEVRSD